MRRYRNGDGGEVTHHQLITRQDEWVRQHGEILRRAHDVLPGSRDQVRLGHVLDALKMGHVVDPRELAWALRRSHEAVDA